MWRFILSCAISSTLGAGQVPAGWNATAPWRNDETTAGDDETTASWWDDEDYEYDYDYDYGYYGEFTTWAWNDETTAQWWDDETTASWWDDEDYEYDYDYGYYYDETTAQWWDDETTASWWDDEDYEYDYDYYLPIYLETTAQWWTDPSGYSYYGGEATIPWWHDDPFCDEYDGEIYCTGDIDYGYSYNYYWGETEDYWTDPSGYSYYGGEATIPWGDFETTLPWWYDYYYDWSDSWGETTIPWWHDDPFCDEYDGEIYCTGLIDYGYSYSYYWGETDSWTDGTDPWGHGSYGTTIPWWYDYYYYWSEYWGETDRWGYSYYGSDFWEGATEPWWEHVIEEGERFIEYADGVVRDLHDVCEHGHARSHELSELCAEYFELEDDSSVEPPVDCDECCNGGSHHWNHWDARDTFDLPRNCGDCHC